ncbi:MAG: PKD domain-containing protein [Saprospiraceae bacterium]
MKRLFRLFLLTSSLFLFSQINAGAQTQAYIIGPTSLCVGECAVFEVALIDTSEMILTSFWDYNGISLQGNPVTLCMDNPDGFSLVVSGFTTFQNDFVVETFIEPSSSLNPIIISTNTQCPDSLAACDRICAFNSATYEVNNIPPGTDVSWQVLGAESFTPNGSSVTVDWGAPGQGEVSVVVGGGGSPTEPLQVFCGMQGFSINVPPSPAGDAYVNLEGGGGAYVLELYSAAGIPISTMTTMGDAVFPALPPDSYAVNVVNPVSGIVGFCNFTIVAAPDQCWLTANPTLIQHPSSCNACDGAIEIMPIPQGTALSFAWSNGSTTPNQTGLCPGNYSLTTTDAFGCTNAIDVLLVCQDSIGGGCVGESSLCVEILEEPEAIISSTPPAFNGVIEICQGQTVYFENESQNAASYIWDFGDLNTSTHFEPNHTYPTPGTYTVSLIARNACYCNDTTFIEVNVLPADVPEISCIGTVCEGESVTYATDANCGTFIWDVSGGGNILDGGGPSDNFVTVEWLSGPLGEISLAVSGCAGNICTTPNVIPIPIISESAQIQGKTNVCEGSTEEYFIPNYQGTEITWSVMGSGNIVDGQGTERVTINWFGNANQGNPQKVIVAFNNCYLGCEGKDTLDVNIVPSFYAKGPIEVCEKTIEEYNSFNSITSALTPVNWQVINAAGAVVWSSPAATATANVDWNLPLGTYTVRAESANAAAFCNQDYEIFVDVIAAPLPVNGIDGSIEICPGETYAYSADGLPINDFNWTVTGGTPANFKGNPINVTWATTGPYQIAVTQTATSGLGCTSDPFMMTADEVPPFSITGNAQVCLEETGTYSVPAFDQLEYQWTISPADRGTVTSGQGTENIEVLWHSDGPATISVSVCGTTENINVTVLPLPVPQVVHPAEICQNTVAAVQTTTPYNAYEWLDDNGLVVSTAAAPNLPAGYYELRVIDQNGCEGNTSFDIFEWPEPVVGISVPIYAGICPGGPSVTITASTTADGYDFQWYGNGIPVGSNSPFLTVNTVGQFTVEVTDQNGCTNQSNTLTIADCASAGGTCVNGVCVGPQCNNPNGCPLNGGISFQIQKTGDCLTHNYINTSMNDVAGSWGWSFGDPSSGANNSSNLENPSHTFSSVGFYSVIFVGEVAAFGGGTCPDGVLQQDTIIAIADFDYESACPGSPVAFTDISEILPYATLTGWSWNFGDPASGAANTSTDQHPVHVYQTAGTYQVRLTVTEASGCEVSIIRNVKVFDPPSVSFALPTITCENTAMPFTALVSNDVVEVAWDFGDPGSGAANTATKMDTYHEFGAVGVYPVTLSATNVYGCTVSYTDNVTVTPNTLGGSIAFSQPSPICEGDNVTLTAPTGGVSYVWSTSQPANQITVSTAGVYDVTLTDADGCTYSPAAAQVDIYGEPNGIIKAVEYNEFGQPVAFFEDFYSVCEGEDVYLVIQGSLNYGYQWSGGNGNGSAIAFTEDRGNLLPVGNHDFTVTVTDNTTGCTSEEGPFTVRVYPKPDVQISSVPGGFLCENNPATLSVVGPNASYTYSWNTGETGNSINVIAGGIYFAQAVNQFGCKSRSNEIVLNNAPDIDNIPTGCHTRCDPDTLCLPSMPLVSTFQWFFNGSPMPAPNGTVAEPIFVQSGEYHVIMTDIYGCKSTSDVLTLDLFPGFGDLLGNVYFDVNQNGIIDGPDTLVSGINIFLNDGTSNIDTVTSSLGNYVFSNILSTDYTVELDTLNLPDDWFAYFVTGDVELIGCDVEEQFDWLLTNQCVPETYQETFYDCPGGGIVFDGTFIPTGEVDTFTYTSFTGCDSVIFVNVDPFVTVLTQEELGACTGTTVTYQGVELSPGDQEQFTLTDVNGCDSVVQVTVVEWQTYSSNLTLTACENSTIDYNGQQLSPGDQQDFMFTTINGCDSIIAVSVTAAPVDTTALPLQVCFGEMVEYNGQQFSDGDQATFLLTNQYGCDSTIELSVTQSSAVTYDLMATEICWNGTDGQIEVQNVQGGTAPYLVSLDGNNYQPALSFENLEVGTYTVYLLDGNDCQFEESIAIPMIDQMTVEIENETMECGDLIELAPIIVSQLPYDIQWTDGPISPTYQVAAPGVYNFTVTNSCEMLNESVVVNLQMAGLDGMIYMPNSFSPNDDGKNDCYKGYVAPDVNVAFYDLKIFDRWGSLMFQTSDPNACWDGVHRDKHMQPGVFAWYMELRVLNCDGNILDIFEEGDIHLIR